MERLFKITALSIGSLTVSFLLWLLLVIHFLKQFGITQLNVVTFLLAATLMCVHYLVHTLTLKNGPHEAANTDYFIKSYPRSDHSLDIFEHAVMLLSLAWIDHLCNLIVEIFRKVFAVIRIYQTLRKKMSDAWEEFLWCSGW